MAALVTEVTTMLDSYPEMVRLVLAEAPYPREYLSMFVHLQRPEVEIHVWDDGMEAAGKLAPCIYLALSATDPNRFSLYVLE